MGMDNVSEQAAKIELIARKYCLRYGLAYTQTKGKNLYGFVKD